MPPGGDKHCRTGIERKRLEDQATAIESVVEQQKVQGACPGRELDQRDGRGEGEDEDEEGE